MHKAAFTPERDATRRDATRRKTINAGRRAAPRIRCERSFKPDPVVMLALRCVTLRSGFNAAEGDSSLTSTAPWITPCWNTPWLEGAYGR